MKKLNAKLVALPAKWNTFHYIVETDAEENSNRVLYFSEAARGKPLNTELNEVGTVRFDGLIFHWEPVEKKKLPSDITLEEWLSDDKSNESV